MKLGATVVNFSPLYTVPELAAQIEDSGTRVLFTISASALLPNALEVMELTRLERLVVGSVAGALPPAKSLLYRRSEEHTSELQSLMRISYAVFCLKKKKKKHTLDQQRRLNTHTD